MFENPSLITTMNFQTILYSLIEYKLLLIQILSVRLAVVKQTMVSAYTSVISFLVTGILKFPTILS